MVQAWRRFGSFYNAIGQDGGPKTPDEARKAYQGFVHEMLLQMTDGRETETTPVFLASPNGEGLLSAVMATSAKEGIAYEPLRLIMTAVSPAAPALVVQRLGTYKRMKAQNVAHLYVSDDAAALYEAAIVAQQAGEAPEKLQETIRRFGDADTKGYVTENAGKASLRGQSFDITVPGRFFDQSSADVFNRGYMDGRLDALVRVGLSRNLEPAQAQEFAKQRFNEAHAFLDIGGRLYAVPRTEVQDPKASTDALNWFASEVAQGLAKKTGADPAGALLNATAANGRQMQFFISDEGGNPLSGYFTLNEALQVYRKRFPSQARAEANKASAQLQQTRKRARAYQAEHAGDALPDRPGFGPQK